MAFNPEYTYMQENVAMLGKRKKVKGPARSKQVIEGQHGHAETINPKEEEKEKVK